MVHRIYQSIYPALRTSNFICSPLPATSEYKHKSNCKIVSICIRLNRNFHIFFTQEGAVENYLRIILVHIYHIYPTLGVNFICTLLSTKSEYKNIQNFIMLGVYIVEPKKLPNIFTKSPLENYLGTILVVVFHIYHLY